MLSQTFTFFIFELLSLLKVCISPGYRAIFVFWRTICRYLIRGVGNLKEGKTIGFALKEVEFKENVTYF